MKRADAASKAKISRTWRILRGLNLTFLGICALLVVAAYIPAVPFIGFFGTWLIPAFAPWFIIVPLVLESVVLLQSKRAYRREAQTLCIVAFLVSLGTFFVLLSLIDVAHQNGVRIETALLFQIESMKGGAGPDRVIQYDKDENGPLPMAIYLPKRTDGRVAPVLIDVHGGGWIGGTMLDHNRDLKWYADQGWLVLSPEYTLSSSSLHLWNRSTEQIGCAMAWAKQNASDLGADASFVSMFGDSAGGNLAINAAYMANHDNLKSDCSGSIPHTRSVVATYPAVDPVSFYENHDLLLGGIARKMVGEYIGGEPAKNVARYASVSSSTYLTSDAPPTLIFVGKADHLVPPIPTFRFAELAKHLGANVSLIQIPYGEHGFDGNVGSLGNQLVRKATSTFLRLHERRQ